jgi:hypothetical protein
MGYQSLFTTNLMALWSLCRAVPFRLLEILVSFLSV